MAITPLEYLNIIRGLPCLITEQVSVPHHLKTIGMGRNRKKQLQEHFTAVPLSFELHNEIHIIGLKKFNKKYNIDLWKESHRLLIRYCSTTTN